MTGINDLTQVRKINHREVDMAAVQKAFYSGEDHENCYLFSPSISKRKTVGRQTYYVRRYFHGGKDFEKAMKRLAAKQINKNTR